MRLAIIFLSGLVAIHPAASARDYGVERDPVLALGRLVDVPDTYEAAAIESADELSPLFYDGLPWDGRPTRVFAWLGLPAPRGNGAAPGIILVHGGGGTAFKEWVRYWNNRGFAAMNIALEGKLDTRSPTNPKAWQAHSWPGPARLGIYGDSDEPLADQYAIALGDNLVYQNVCDPVVRMDRATMPAL